MPRPSMHSWIYRHRDALARAYGLTPPTAARAESASGPGEGSPPAGSGAEGRAEQIPLRELEPFVLPARRSAG